MSADVGLQARSMPHAIDAERAVLGALLAVPEQLSSLEGLRSAHFFRAAHRLIFDALLALHARQITPDLVTLKNALASKGTLEEAGGGAYLASLTDGVPLSSNLEGYVGIVREKAKRRELVLLAQRLGEGALGDADDVDALVQSAARDLFAIEQEGRAGGFVSMGELAQGVMAKVEQWYERKQHVTGVPTGFADLDDMLGGLQPADLIVLAGRPSMGKSALMMGIATHVAKTTGPVGVFSLEMSAEALATRELSAAARINGYRLRRGYLHASDWSKLAEALIHLGEARLWVDETPNLTVFDMRARARRLKAEHGLSLLVIDYLQLMDTADDVRRDENRVLAIGKMTRGLKQLAKELNVPIVLLSQLSRAVEARGDKRPMLSDLRESGSIEQDADVVMFIYREHVYRKSEPEHDAELIVGKQRNGPTGTVKLYFQPELARFYNHSPDETEQGRLADR